MQQLRVGVVGAGAIGRLHGRLVAELPNAKLTGIVDSRPEIVDRIASELETQPYRSVEELFDTTSELDALVVATPEAEHRPPVVTAAARGCAVFVEKPIASNLPDADAMINACDWAEVPLLVGHILRHEAAYAAARQAVEEGRLGRSLTAYARRNTGIQEGQRLGGRTSVVQYLAVHDIDLLLWLHEASVETVTARAVYGQMAQQYGVADFVWMWIRFADGVLGIVECGWALPSGWADWGTQDTAWQPFGDCRLELIGTEDFLCLDLRSMNVADVDSRGWRVPDTRHWPSLNGRVGGAARLQMEHFLECASGKASPVCDGRAGRAALAVCVAAEVSLGRNGAEVSLEDVAQFQSSNPSGGGAIGE